MLSYIWDSMLVVLVGGIGWSVASFVVVLAICIIVAIVATLCGKYFDN